MAIALEKFLFCLELQLGGIIIAWWGMIASALSIVGVISALVFGKGHYNNFFPVHISTGSAVISGLILILILAAYFYFSYQLLKAVQNGNSGQMFGYLVIHGIMVVLFIIGLFSNAASLLVAIIYAYMWFVVYSLYVRSGGTGIV